MEDYEPPRDIWQVNASLRFDEPLDGDKDPRWVDTRDARGDDSLARLTQVLGIDMAASKMRRAPERGFKMKEHRRTSQVAIDDIVEGCRGLFAQAVSRVHAGVRAKLATVGVDSDEIEGLNDVFENLADPFDGLETCYKQEKYFLDNLGLIVSGTKNNHVDNST